MRNNGLETAITQGGCDGEMVLLVVMVTDDICIWMESNVFNEW